MKVQFSEIKWDTDGEKVDLPSEVILDVENGLDVENEGADVLSDKYGWCVESFDFEVLYTPKPGLDVTKLQSGDQVWWNDPDDGACSRIYNIQEIKINGEVVTITDKDGSDLECFASELE